MRVAGPHPWVGARTLLQQAGTMYTGVPTSTCSKSHSASGMAIRMQPWDAE